MWMYVKSKSCCFLAITMTALRATSIMLIALCLSCSWFRTHSVEDFVLSLNNSRGTAKADVSHASERMSEEIRLPIFLIIQALKLGDPTMVDDHAEKNALIVENREKIDLLESYRPYFQEVVYDTPRYSNRENIFTCGEASASNVLCHICTYRRNTYHDTHRFACASEIIEARLKISRPGINVKGFLVLHADFFMFPAFLKRMHRAVDNFPFSFWAPKVVGREYRASPDNIHYDELFNVTLQYEPTPRRGWKWWNSYAQQVDIAREEIARAVNQTGLAPMPTALVRSTDKKQFHRWVDMYYIPQALWKHFFPFSRIMLKNNVMNEMAVPLLQQFAAHLEGIDTYIGFNCFGGCCAQPNYDDLNNPAFIHYLNCGHKIDLRDAQMRQAIIQTWKNKSFF